MADQRHILVTGATGFIGKHLINFLTAQHGLVIWGIAKPGGKVNGIQVDCVDLVSSEELSSWRKSKPAFDAIFHLAAYLPTSFEVTEGEKLFFANLRMTYNVLSLAIDDQSALINAASSSVYGAGSEIPFREDTLLQPDNFYSLAKYTGELICGMAQVRFGLKATSLRLSAPYGPGQQAQTVIEIFLNSVLNSRDLTLYGTGARTQDFVYVDDVIQAMWLAYQQQVCGVYNIASGHPVNMRDLAKTVLDLVPGTRSQIIYSGKPDPQETYRGVFSIEKAQRDFGYIPKTSLRDGLRKCLASHVDAG